ncbi:OmpA family protein [Thiolinea disciformis]|uniref:OmpA family protein n=1 Tax=Thiolinea disciformis TaxID=125614 RepID=UPI0003673999|nr:OmpA family protein [Thiolinea disciformis]
MLRRLTTLALFVLFLSVFTYTQAATLAGVKITNQASATYLDTKTGNVEQILSNISSLVVAVQISLDLNQDQTQLSSANQLVYFPHTFINTGNAPEYFKLTANNVEGDNGDLTNLKIYLDENGDGQVNPGEAEISQTDLLKPNERIQLIVVGTVPTTAKAGDQYTIKVIANSISKPTITDTNTDTISITEQAVIRLTRRSDVDCSVKLDLNSHIYQEVSFTNLGKTQPNERLILVDGVRLSGVLFEETLSPYFKLLKEPAFFVSPAQGMLLVADALGNWKEYSQWDGLTYISKLGVLMPAYQIKPTQSGKFGYTLAVQKLPEQSLSINFQTALDSNGDGRIDLYSNSNCQTLNLNDQISNHDDHAVRGIVFDSITLKPVPNTNVQLITLSDNTKIAESVSDSKGTYTFSNIQNGTYYLTTLAPDAYIYPSIYPPQQFTTYHVGEPSYGLGGYIPPTTQAKSAQAGAFTFDDKNFNYSYDIPIDPKQSGNLIAIEKQASAANASIGEMIAYTIKGKNVSGQELYAAHLKDLLPLGLKYIRGTAKLNGKVLDDPQITANDKGAYLDFRLGDTFSKGADYTITYIAQVTALTQTGKHVNTAQLQATTIAGLPIKSPSASAAIQVKQTGVLSDRAIIFGRLSLEKGCPIGTPEQQERGYPLAGVRLYMEDGTYAISDENGQYSLYGLKPGVHVVKVDGHTVPEGLEFLLKDNAQAGSPDSRFADLIPGDFHRADFIAGCPPAGQIKTVEECKDTVVESPKQAAVTSKQVEQCDYATESKAVSKWVTRSVPNAVQPIHFDSGKAIIPPEYVDKLRTLLQLTRDKKNVRFMMVGHTDNQRLKPATKAQFGTNQGLSEARAREVADTVLQQLNVPCNISTAGRGEFQPIAGNNTPEGMAKNRRVELIMMYDEEEKSTIQTTSAEPICKMVDVPVEEQTAPAKTSTATVQKTCVTRTVTEPSPVMERLLAKQKMQSLGWGSELESLDPANTNNLQNLARLADKNGDISSGLIDAHRKQLKTLQSDVAKQQEAEAAKEPEIPNPKEKVKEITEDQAKTGTWLWPMSDTSLDGRFMAIVRAGVDPVLIVNGKEVATTQLGEQIVNKRENAQIMAWYGVDLQEGENTIKIVAKDNFGNQRTLAEKTVKRPSAGVAIKMTVDGTLTADSGRSSVPVKIEILDKNGYPAKGNYFVTLETSQGDWVEPDIQDKVPGHQVKVTNGQRVVTLRSSSQNGEVRLRATAGELQSETDLAQVAELRPLVAVGLLDLRAHQGYASYESLGLRQTSDNADGVEVDGRAAIFMKGHIKGDMNLTFAYDSEKSKEAELLRDINPNEYYRVYGDASLRGFEAQSRSKLYARLERDRHSLMWGDYITDNGSNSADIARTSRTLTGLNGIYDDGKTSVQLFAAQQDNLRGVEEIAGNGTAMFYKIEGMPIVRNSEIIDIVTRDRQNAGLIIKTDKLARFTDYSIDEVTGYITFHREIPSQDSQGNPVSIRISYDHVEDGENYLVAGVRLMHKLNDEVSLGASYTRDGHSSEGYDLAGVHTQYKTPTEQVDLGIAHMEHADANKAAGNAVRLQASKTWDNKGRTEFSAAQADAGFTNSSGGVTADRRELKLSHQQPVGKDVEVKGELVHSESLSTDQQRQSVELSASTRVDDWRIKGGMRHIRASDGTKDEAVNTVLVGVERNVEVLERKGSVKAEYERELGGTRQRTTLGAELDVTDKTRAYVRYEESDRLASGTLAGAVDTQTSLVAGVKSQVLPSTELYSEYRLQDDMSGQDVVAVSGARATLDLQDKLQITPSLEFMNYLEDSEKQDAVAASIGITDTRDPNSKKIGRFDIRHTADEDQYGVKGTFAQKFNDSTTLLIQDELRYQTYDDSSKDDTVENSLMFAAAIRPMGNESYNGLYAYKLDTSSKTNTNTHILSTHQNYQVNDDLAVSGRLGAKRQYITKDGAEETTNAVMADARALWDVTDKLSVDLHSGLLSTEAANEMQYMLGAGLVFNVIENVRIGAGYNFNGFLDKDLDPEGYNTQGAYLGLQMKVDEDLFEWLDGKKK